MSCHTYVMQKVRTLTAKEQQAIIENEKDWMLEYCPQSVGEYSFEEIWDTLYNSQSIAEVQDKLPNYWFEGSYEMIDNMCGGKSGCLFGNDLYKEIDCDYPFRMYGYPTEKFSDAEQLIEFISKEENKGRVLYRNDGKYCIEVNDYLKERIRKYFDDNKNIMIHFG